MLLDEGVDVNAKDENGNSLLTVAAQNGLKRITKLLLRRGAGMNEVVRQCKQRVCVFVFRVLLYRVRHLSVFLCSQQSIGARACRTCVETRHCTTHTPTSSRRWLST